MTVATQPPHNLQTEDALNMAVPGNSAGFLLQPFDFFHGFQRYPGTKVTTMLGTRSLERPTLCLHRHTILGEVSGLAPAKCFQSPTETNSKSFTFYHCMLPLRRRERACSHAQMGSYRSHHTSLLYSKRPPRAGQRKPREIRISFR